jgi:hypothetical protein
MMHIVPYFPALAPPRQSRRIDACGLFLSLFTALLLLVSCPAMALSPQHLQIAPVATSVHKGEDLFLNLSLTVDHEDSLRDLLKDGAALQLGIVVDMRRKRAWWADVEITRREYASILRHDPLARDFVVSFPSPEGEKTLRDKNLTRLLHASWRKLSLYVAALHTIRAQGPDEEFIIACTLSLQHAEVPPWLKNSSIFWSPDLVPQEKRELSFRLPAATD